MPSYVKKALTQFCHEMKKTATFPVPICTNKVWCHQTVCNNRINSTTVRPTGQTLHTITVRKVPLPRQSSQQHSSMPDQSTGVTILNPHRRYNAILQATTRLLRNTRISSANFQCKQYGTSRAQQCKLPQRTKSTQ